MFADQQKVEDAGYTFIAIGGNTFQAGYTFHALLAAVAGPEIYNRFYGGADGKPDATVFDEPGAARRHRDASARSPAQTDEGWVNRAWNDTTNTVIAGNALMQIHGDWMKGAVAGERQGARRRLRLHQHPRHQGGVGDGRLVRHPRRRGRGDAEGRGGLRRHGRRPGRSTPSSPICKGSSPVRIDVPTDKLDACNKLVLESLQKPDFSVQNPFYIADLDWMNSVWNTMFTFQGDPNMTTDDVIAMLRDDDIDIEINESDLKIDTYRASGAGGQHVNTTDSAVRITHVPTEIVVQCQNQRSQHKNRAEAMKQLKARLYEAELQRREAESDAQNATKTDIGWGHQIRSYVLQPYQLVKDLRTGVTSTAPSDVLDGDLDRFMAAALSQRVTGERIEVEDVE